MRSLRPLRTLEVSLKRTRHTTLTLMLLRRQSRPELSLSQMRPGVELTLRLSRLPSVRRQKQRPAGLLAAVQQR